MNLVNIQSSHKAMRTNFNMAYFPVITTIQYGLFVSYSTPTSAAKDKRDYQYWGKGNHTFLPSL